MHHWPHRFFAIAVALDFIQLGASTSRSSGKHYLVRCGSAAPTESRLWPQDRLAALRQAKP